jgi:hypothetical protein
MSATLYAFSSVVDNWQHSKQAASIPRVHAKLSGLLHFGVRQLQFVFVFGPARINASSANLKAFRTKSTQEK